MFFVLFMVSWAKSYIFQGIFFLFSVILFHHNEGKKNILLVYQSEKAIATHSSTLAWKIPCTKEPGGLQSVGSLRVGHD